MKPKVYFAERRDFSTLEDVANDVRKLVRESGVLEGIHSGDFVAIKLTFGEEGNRGYPKPPLVRALVEEIKARGGRPFLTETNTLYHGRRKNALDHMALAREHGFTLEATGAPIIFGDGLLGRDAIERPAPGPLVQRAWLSPVLKDIDFLVGLAHLTGHIVEGIGGAIKNLGMGLASRAGKLAQHSVLSPTIEPERCIACGRCEEVCPEHAISHRGDYYEIDRNTCVGCAECLGVCPTGAVRIDWSRETGAVQRKTAEYAKAVVEAVKGRAAFVNILHHITKNCDCLGAEPEFIAPDAGLAASLDPVALDAASTDIVIQRAGRDVFSEAWPDVDWRTQIRHADQIGLGSREYDLVEI